MSDTIILVPEMILPSPTAAVQSGDALAVCDHRIALIGRPEALLERWPDARVEALPDCLVMAGLINAHQHGRGISQIQLGYHDDFLETWIQSRRGRGVLDA